MRAGINVALIKYWGKADDALNLPAVGSLSLTLADLGTHTSVRWRQAEHRFELDGVRRDDPQVVATLDAVRDHLGATGCAHVCSRNSVPTASGLASSASGAAALVSAAWLAAGGALDVADPTLLRLVRLASGSGPRSLRGGLVGLDVQGRVEPLDDGWDLRMVVAVNTLVPKATKSRPGMAHTRDTSPYYAAWVDTHPADLTAARAAVTRRDLPALGALMEHSTWKMHACMLAARPALNYLQPVTLAVIQAVHALREAGVGAWYTMDAGPHVKVLCAAADAQRVAQAVQAVAGVRRIHVAEPGPGVHQVADHVPPC